MSLSTDEQARLLGEYKKLVDFYQKTVKEIVLTSERSNQDQKLSIPAIVEIRSAFDHIARSHAAMYGLTPEEDLKKLTGLSLYEYCRKNLDKAHGHLYRAAYDAYDVIAVALALKNGRLLDSVSNKALFAVIPNAHEKIMRPYSDAMAIVTKEKTKKDVISREEEQSQFDQYEKAVNMLKDINDSIIEKMPSLTAYDDEDGKKDKNNTRFTILVALLSILVTILLAKLL